MVCIPCIIAPVLLYIWYRFIQPIVLSIWNPWAKKEIRMDAAGDAPGKEKPNAIAGDATMDGADQAKLDGADQAKLANGLSEPSADSGENKKTS